MTAPSVRLADVCETVGDVRFEDPFRRLEDDGAEALAWQEALDAEARDALRSLPDHTAIHAAVERHLAACAVTAPIRAGDRWFHLEGAAVVRVAPEPGAAGDVLVRAERLAPGLHPHIDWMVPSPDGARVAIGVSGAGDEQSVLHVVSAAGDVAGPRVPHVWTPPAWIPGEDALLAFAGRVSSFGGLRHELVEWRAGEPPRTVPVRLGAALRHAVQVSPDGRYVAILEHPVAPRLLRVLDRATGEWTAAAPLPPGATCHGVFLGGRYWAVNTAGASRGRLVSAPVDRLDDPVAWEVVVPEGPDVLRAVTAMGGTLVLCAFDRGASRLRLLSARGEIPLPGDGLCSTSGRAPAQYGAAPPVRADADGITFVHSEVARSPALLRLDAGGLRHIVPSAIELEGVESEWIDGAVPYERIWRGDDRPRPALLVVYGGWNAMTTSKGYLGALAPIVEAGGAVVYAHVRGDATLGADRWHGGRRRSKANAVADTCAVAADLAARGLVPPGRLGIWGASNGGLVAAAAIARHPERFAVAVAVAPMADMGRFLRDRFGEHAAWEYGDPRCPADAAALRAYSPYHHAGPRRPPTLVVCGETDLRAPPWHGRKLVAAMRRAAPDAPALLRVHAAHGHVTTTDDAPAWLIAEWLAFVMHHLGLRA